VNRSTRSGVFEMEADLARARLRQSLSQLGWRVERSNKSICVARNHFFLILAVVAAGLASTVNTSRTFNPQVVIFMSLGMMCVVNIAQASDESFSRRHRVLVALILAGIAFPLMYLVFDLNSQPNTLIHQEFGRTVLCILECGLIGGSAIIGYFLSTREMS
jgi:hypothetical protein